MQEEQERGATLLIAAHTISAVEPLATAVAILLDGRLAAHVTAAGLGSDYGTGNSLKTFYHQIARQHRPRFLEGIVA